MQVIGSSANDGASVRLATALGLARGRYGVGEIELLNVLQIQSRWIGAPVGLLRVRSGRLANRGNLHLALDGRFDAGS